MFWTIYLLSIFINFCLAGLATYVILGHPAPERRFSDEVERRKAIAVVALIVLVQFIPYIATLAAFVFIVVSFVLYTSKH